MSELDQGRSRSGQAASPARATDRPSQSLLTAPRALLSLVLDSLPFEMWVMDSSGRYVLQNAPCVQHWGDLTGATVDTLAVDDRQLAKWQSNDRRALSGEVVTGEFEHDFGGEKKRYVDILSPLIVSDDVRGLVGMNVELTDSVQRCLRPDAFVELRDGNEATGAGNDIDRLLGVITWGARLAQSSTTSSDTIRYLDEILAAGGRGKAILETDPDPGRLSPR